jgi:hypothetical protein
LSEQVLDGLAESEGRLAGGGFQRRPQFRHFIGAHLGGEPLAEVKVGRVRAQALPLRDAKDTCDGFPQTPSVLPFTEGKDNWNEEDNLLRLPFRLLQRFQGRRQGKEGVPIFGQVVKGMETGRSVGSAKKFVVAQSHFALPL